MRQGAVDRGTRLRHAGHQRQVALAHRAAAECLPQRLVRLARAGGEQESGRPGIEAVCQAAAERVAEVGGLREASRQESRHGTALSGVERMRRHATRFVDHDEPLVEVDDPDGQVGLGLETQRGQRDPIAGEHPRALRDDAAVHAHESVVDQPSCDAPRQRRARAQQERVEASGLRDEQLPLVRGCGHAGMNDA